MSSEQRFLNEKILRKLDKQLEKITGRIGVDRKTLDEVFDKSTLHTLGKLISDRVIDIVDFDQSPGAMQYDTRIIGINKNFNNFIVRSFVFESS